MSQSKSTPLGVYTIQVKSVYKNFRNGKTYFNVSGEYQGSEFRATAWSHAAVASLIAADNPGPVFFNPPVAFTSPFTKSQDGKYINIPTPEGQPQAPAQSPAPAANPFSQPQAPAQANPFAGQKASSPKASGSQSYASDPKHTNYRKAMEEVNKYLCTKGIKDNKIWAEELVFLTLIVAKELNVMCGLESSTPEATTEEKPQAQPEQGEGPVPDCPF